MACLGQCPQCKQIRHKLHQTNATQFPMGQIGTGIHNLGKAVTTETKALTSKSIKCPQCNRLLTQITQDSFIPSGFLREWNMFENNRNCDPTIQQDFPSMTEWLDYYANAISIVCRHCHLRINNDLHVCNNIHAMPAFIGIHVPTLHIKVEKYLLMTDELSTRKKYRLCGLAYLGGFHYTSRIVDSNYIVWYNNGMTTGQACQVEGRLSAFTSEQLLSYTINNTTRNLVALFYCTL